MQSSNNAKCLSRNTKSTFGELKCRYVQQQPWYSVATSRSFTATPAQLLLDVALGVALHRPEAAHHAALAVLATGGSGDPALPMPLEAAVRTLAHVAVGGFSMAELSAQDLASARTTKRYDRHTKTYAAAALARVDEADHARVEAGLSKAARGGLVLSCGLLGLGHCAAGSYGVRPAIGLHAATALQRCGVD